MYATITEADSYFSNRLFSDTWTATSETDKEKALKMATAKINRLKLRGVKAVDTQVNEFPRAIYSETLGQWVTETAVAQCVKDATCEEALALLKAGANGNKRAELQAQGVKSFSIGHLSETFSGTSNRLLSLEARDLLAPYLGGVYIV